ncbi:MAG TPA: hypothetical protein V6D06_20670 [Trichocoleus sp.]
MIIAFPVEVTLRLMTLASRYGLTIPIPLSSPLKSYASPEELELIQQALVPLAAQSEEAAAILAELQQTLHSQMMPEQTLQSA